MELDPTPEHQELLRKVEDIVWASDRAFFAASPKRRLRVRPSYALEIKDQEMTLATREADLEPGLCWWTLVVALAPGLRMRFRFAWRHDAMPDPPEAVCRGVYKTFIRSYPDLHQKIGKIRRSFRQPQRNTP